MTFSNKRTKKETSEDKVYVQNKSTVEQKIENSIVYEEEEKYLKSCFSFFTEVLSEAVL